MILVGVLETHVSSALFPEIVLSHPNFYHLLCGCVGGTERDRERQRRRGTEQFSMCSPGWPQLSIFLPWPLRATTHTCSILHYLLSFAIILNDNTDDWWHVLITFCYLCVDCLDNCSYHLWGKESVCTRVMDTRHHFTAKKDHNLWWEGLRGQCGEAEVWGSAGVE